MRPVTSIFDSDPKNWRDLQQLVAQTFEELGCRAGVECTIRTARGESEIDIYVEDPVAHPPLVYLVECKHWKNRVPKSVVHSFRTIVSDSGANCGYLISRVGFQSGAYEAAANSPVQLLSFQEFQETLCDRWFEAMSERPAIAAGRIFPYMNTLKDQLLERVEWTEKLRMEFMHGFFKYSLVMNAMSNARRFFASELRFPVEVPSPNSTPTNRSTIVLKSPREYFNVAIPFADRALEELRAFFGFQEGEEPPPSLSERVARDVTG